MLERLAMEKHYLIGPHLLVTKKLKCYEYGPDLRQIYTSSPVLQFFYFSDFKAITLVSKIHERYRYVLILNCTATYFSVWPSMSESAFFQLKKPTIINLKISSRECSRHLKLKHLQARLEPTWVEALMRLHFKAGLALPTNIRVGWKWLIMTPG